MITYKIHLVRHGMTAANERGLYAGRRTDLPICGEGEQRLRALKKHCGYPQVQKVYTSPLLRCTQTAELIFPENWVVPVDGFAECDFGVFDGQAISELKADARYNEWVASGLREAPPGGEGAKELEERVSAAFEAAFADMMQNKLTSCAIVTHGGIIAMLMAKYARPRGEGMYGWMAEDGCGWTVLMSPQMWMRDGGFEVYEKLPYRAEAYLRLGAAEFERELKRWNEQNREENFDEP